MRDIDKVATPAEAVTIAMEVARWFMAPVRKVVPAYLNRDNFRIIEPKAIPMYRGHIVRLPTIRRFHHDFTLIPSETSGLRGLAAIKNRRQHKPNDCPNNIFHMQVANHNPLIGSEETYALLFYHQESQSVIDLEIIVNDIDDEDCVTINGQVFVPLPPQRYMQTSRYNFVRRREIELAAKDYVENAMRTLVSYEEDDQKRFYIDMAKKLGISPVVRTSQKQEHG